MTDMSGWTIKTYRDGIEYRMLVSDAGKPSYSGSARRYKSISVYADGRVLSRSSAGYVRWHETLEEAVESVK